MTVVPLQFTDVNGLLDRSPAVLVDDSEPLRGSGPVLRVSVLIQCLVQCSFTDAVFRRAVACDGLCPSDNLWDELGGSP